MRVTEQVPTMASTLDLVLDTNVVLDWLAFRHPVGAELEEALTSGRCRWLCTRAMRDELADVIARDSLARWSIDAPAVLAVFDTLGVGVGTLVPLCGAASPRCRDPDDQMFIDLAIACSAHALLTRDRALLRLASRVRPLGVRIETPETWSQRQSALRVASWRGPMLLDERPPRLTSVAHLFR